MNYPSGIKKVKVNKSLNPIVNELSHKNRGMTLENDLNNSNEYYQEIDKAYIYKKPTPIKITKVDYPSRDKTVIKEAFFTVPSTTDYNGLYNGKYIDFEAKETTSKTSFPLANIHKHQINHIRNINNNGGICFLIVRFTTLNETYLLPSYNFLNYIDSNKKKSIPLKYFQENGYIIHDKYIPRIDYLEIVNKVYGGANLGNN